MAIHQKNGKKNSAGYLIKTTMDKELTKVTAAIFVRNWANIAAFFDSKVLTQAVHQFKVRDFATFDYVRRERLGQLQHYDSKGYILLTPEPVMAYVTEYSDHNGGGWERRVQKLCYEYIVADNYQVKEKDLIKTACEFEFPYLQKFLVSHYHMDSPATRKEVETLKKERGVGYKSWYGAECYVRIGAGMSLYVPYMALKEKDPEIIIKRHSEYHKSYYNRKGCEEILKKKVNLLETKEAKKFFEHVKKGY